MPIVSYYRLSDATAARYEELEREGKLTKRQATMLAKHRGLAGAVKLARAEAVMQRSSETKEGEDRWAADVAFLRDVKGVLSSPIAFAVAGREHAFESARRLVELADAARTALHQIEQLIGDDQGWGSLGLTEQVALVRRQVLAGLRRSP